MENESLQQKNISKESIFIVGYVSSVEGRKVRVRVNKNKNLSHLLYSGKILKNVSVGGFIKIAKGFVEIIGKVEGEFTTTEKFFNEKYNREDQKIVRYLDVTLFGHFERDRFEQGIKEMPLVDNKCYLLDKEEFSSLHQFFKCDESGQPEPTIPIGHLTEEPSQKIEVSVNNLFASHIGIFGNTGSGKSNTLAKIYHELFKKFETNNSFKEKSRFVFIDFNGEYGNSDLLEGQSDDILHKDKKVYFLNTRKKLGDIKDEEKIPLHENDLLDIELISILASATDKTQRPFISRTIDFFKKVHKEKDDDGSDNNPLEFFKNILKKRVIDIFSMVHKERSHVLLEYLKAIVGVDDTSGFKIPGWQNSFNYFISPQHETSPTKQITEDEIKELGFYKKIDDYKFPADSIEKIIHFLYLQIIFDIYNDKAQNEHISPAISKLKSKQKGIQKVLNTKDNKNIFPDNGNLVILNFKKCDNQDIKKSIPLIIIKKLYEEHKQNHSGRTLHIVIDEAHNILSDHSARESESWKDYRLEVFEEIIKEGRKFNVFLTIASQRPYDISQTIISQLHNYFIHKLINNYDVEAISKTVAYLDKLSFETLSILSTGSCFFAGVSTKIPVKVSVDLLDKNIRPNSGTIELDKLWNTQ